MKAEGRRCERCRHPRWLLVMSVSIEQNHVSCHRNFVNLSSNRSLVQHSSQALSCFALFECKHVDLSCGPTVRVYGHCRVSAGACKRACNVESVATFHACQQAWTGRCRHLWPVWLVGNADQGYRWAHLWPWFAFGYHDNVNNELIICFVHKASKMQFFYVFNGNIIVLPCLDLRCFLTPTTVTLVLKAFEETWFERWGLLWCGKQFSVLKKNGGWRETISSEWKIIHHLNMSNFSV